MVVRLERSEAVSWLIIDREEKANSLNYEHLISLKDILEKACNLSDKSSVVAIMGSGKRYFSAGIDLVEIGNIKSVEETSRIVIKGIGGVLRSILLCKKPVIAAVNGDTYGLSVELIQVSDLAYATENAKIAVPALRWGLIPPVTPFISLDKRSVELILRGNVISSKDAMSIGLINEVVDDLDKLKTKVENVAKDIMKMDPDMISVIKEAKYEALWPIVYKGLLLMTLSMSRTETRKRIEEGFLKKS